MRSLKPGYIVYDKQKDTYKKLSKELNNKLRYDINKYFKQKNIKEKFANLIKIYYNFTKGSSSIDNNFNKSTIQEILFSIIFKDKFYYINNKSNIKYLNSNYVPDLLYKFNNYYINVELKSNINKRPLYLYNKDGFISNKPIVKHLYGKHKKNFNYIESVNNNFGIFLYLNSKYQINKSSMLLCHTNYDHINKIKNNTIVYDYNKNKNQINIKIKPEYNIDNKIQMTKNEIDNIIIDDNIASEALLMYIKTNNIIINNNNILKKTLKKILDEIGN